MCVYAKSGDVSTLYVPPFQPFHFRFRVPGQVQNSNLLIQVLPVVLKPINSGSITPYICSQNPTDHEIDALENDRETISYLFKPWQSLHAVEIATSQVHVHYFLFVSKSGNQKMYPPENQ